MKSALFLMEQLIVILIFALCAAVCAEIFAASFILSSDSKDINNALLIAECGAESYKAANGNAKKAALILTGSVDDTDTTIYAYYDKSRQACAKNEAAYVLSISDITADETPASLLFGGISVQKTGGEEIIAFTVAARRQTE